MIVVPWCGCELVLVDSYTGIVSWYLRHLAIPWGKPVGFPVQKGTMNDENQGIDIGILLRS